MFKTKHSYVDFLEGILIGGSLAAAATFVFGTTKGKKLQREVLEKYKKLGHKAEHYLENAKKAMKSPVAKKLKRLAKKTLKRKTARKVVRRARRKITARRARH